MLQRERAIAAHELGSVPKGPSFHGCPLQPKHRHAGEERRHKSHRPSEDQPLARAHRSQE